jgi:hypothetical protein
LDNPVQGGHRSGPIVGRSQINIQILDPHNEPVAQIIIDGPEIELHLARGYVSATEWSDDETEITI